MERENRGLTILSVIVLIINLSIFVAWLIIVGRFVPLYQEADLELPVITRINWSLRHIYMIFALILIAKEFLRKKTVTLIINCLVFILLFNLLASIYFTAVKFAMLAH